MSYFEEHKAVATLISITIGVAAVAILYYLSTLDGGDQPVPEDAYSLTIGDGAGSGDGADGTGAAGAMADARPGEIQQVDFSQMAAPDIGDDQEIEGVLLVDVDGNGSQEAVLLVRGAGERRPLDWYLFGIDGATASRLYERLAITQGELRVDGPMIVEQEAEYQAGDADCCPSRVKTNYYVWKDGSLQLSRSGASAPGAPG